MSSELRIGAGSGNTVYAHILNASSRLWNGSAFEVYSSPSYPNYTVAMTELGTSGVYVGDFPTGISDSGIYEIFYYIQQAGSAAEGDPIGGVGSVDWTGSSVAPSGSTASGELSATDFYSYVLRTFKRTDKSLEFYDAVNESIAEIRRDIETAREESEQPLTVQISTIGTYRMNVETNMSRIADVFIRDSSDGRYLVQISKSLFDALYSKWGTSSSQRGKPQHWCLFGGQVYVGPVPDSTSYTYVVTQTDDDHVLVTSATSSVPFTTTDYREILKTGVLYRMYASVENDTQAQKYLALWNDGKIKIDDKERRNRAGVLVTPYNDF